MLFFYRKLDPKPGVGVADPLPFCRADDKPRSTQSNPYSYDECPYYRGYGERISLNFSIRTEDRFVSRNCIVALTSVPVIHPWERLTRIAM